MITTYLKTLEENRKILLEKTKQLTPDQYNLVPEGFNNNIIWNMAHALLVSESYLYRHTNFKPPIHEFDLMLFKKGTKPNQNINDEEIKLIRESLIETVPVFEKKREEENDSVEDAFQNNTESFPVSEASLQFILFHDKIHFHTIERMLEIIKRSK